MPIRKVLADREHRYRRVARPDVFRALTADRAKWVVLHPGELLPGVLASVANERVMWSSFWPVSPDDIIELDLRWDGCDTILRFRWSSSTPPDERGIGITRQRLNMQFGGNIRGWLV